MPLTILIADADLNAQIIMRTLLDLRGYAVRGASDGVEAWEVLRHEDIALAIVDLQLPGLNGFELLRRLNGRFGSTLRSSHQPRTLMMAEEAEPETQQFVRRLGADAFLRKPIAPRRLIDTVERLLIERNAANAQHYLSDQTECR